MGLHLDEKELRRRAIAGVRDEVEAFGSGAPDSRLICRDGLLASVVPAPLQASKAGAPACERLGFLDLGFIEMWELRK